MGSSVRGDPRITYKPTFERRLEMIKARGVSNDENTLVLIILSMQLRVSSDDGSTFQVPREAYARGTSDSSFDSRVNYRFFRGAIVEMSEEGTSWSTIPEDPFGSHLILGYTGSGFDSAVSTKVRSCVAPRCQLINDKSRTTRSLSTQKSGFNYADHSEAAHSFDISSLTPRHHLNIVSSNCFQASASLPLCLCGAYSQGDDIKHVKTHNLVPALSNWRFVGHRRLREAAGEAQEDLVGAPFLRRPDSERADDEDTDLLEIVDGVDTERSERASSGGHPLGAFFQNAVLGHGGQGNINLRKSMQPRCLSDAANSLQFRLLFHTCCQRVTVWLSRMNRLACPRTTEHLGCHGFYMCSVGLQLRERFQTPIQDMNQRWRHSSRPNIPSLSIYYIFFSNHCS
ncbi:hypothetical protein KCU81_g135, partial [Aureobasidium melanogenum]